MANQTPMQKQFASSYEQQRFDMFLNVARELTGRAKQRSLPQGKALDWDKFNAYFEKVYSNYSADELLEEILSNAYWLSSEQAVIDLHFRYLDDAVKAAKAKGKTKDKDDDDLDFVK
ncbi:MAG: hypothetical protein F6K36_08335 [Symploca sp. SIO3C6]|uniref:ELM2 domain-containing protein n=1 Tax=Symploca sp. SIO1C4 TaxID=2607765 RepID=A0A6B3N5T8_9CYAN|nr:hypothetical protein [Symploca sp. SIO3C6]NER26155.1 hypothetical protein [Symploca sp. SIO1C4]